MKKIATPLFKLALSILFTLSVSLSFAQSTGKIAGKITDKKTGEPLIGATLMIEGTQRGAATNVTGDYTILNVSRGTYSILVRYVGYQNKLISEVQVSNNNTTTLNITLDEANTQQLQAVTVKATFKQESTNSLYARQKNNAAITDGITAEAIRRSPDRSASEVLRRVSGATVQDNKFVVVRGLSDRYNNAQLDGTNLPSTEPNRKAFSFDIVPSNLIDNLVISKTATPNLPGDFAGGSVQINTKDIPDENFLTVSAGLAYNTNTTFKNFKSGYRNSLDYLGFDDGSRALPNNFPSTTRINNGSLSQAQQTAALRSLNPNYRVYNTNAFANQNYQISLGRVKDIGKNGNRFGAIVALTYRNAMQTTPDVDIDYHVYQYNDQKYKFSTAIGGLANFAYSFGKNKITWKNIYNRNFDDQYLYRQGFDASTGYQNRYTAFDLIEKGLFKTTVQGDHSVGARGAKLTWVGSYSNVVNKQPDQRKANYALVSGNVYEATIGTLGKQNARYFADLNENIVTGQVDYSLPVNMFKQKGTFKVGLASNYRDRRFDPRFLGPVLNTSAPLEIRQLPLDKIFLRSVIDQNYYNLQDITLADDPYTAHSYTNAGYAMLDNKLSDKLRVVWGLRAEKFDLDLTTKGGNKAKLDNLDLLPSANFTYAATPKANVRLSYSRTVARPELRELAPSTYFDYELIATVQGNTSLKRTQIHNLDLRYEFYPSAGQIISVSAFYKNFKNAIESYFDDKLSTPNITYFNSRTANNFGMEFEFRKTLDLFSPQLKNTTLYTNLALIRSTVKDPRLDLSEPDGKRPMVGQAPYVINAGLLQTFAQNKASINVLYNRVGPRIFRAGGTVFPSVYENARDVIDVQLGYRVFKNKGEFKLNAGDLLNQSTKFYFKEGKSTYPLSEGAIYNRYKLGSTFTLSYTHNFR
ncbi:TonB-dependent receptor [Mucilaginibacter daejeonensis]|uniref:TonB-dependent receptor n=1 Tax=Mucilaginibacter daejeonensis TaxID=398049 RepID=UPI001D17C933|nr:TonB-dependent receptor [Mucilaginibacter daejeonensis]UEG52969.1 TonB-dependent receptor [Mucilaginibacter daejeonensis]